MGSDRGAGDRQAALRQLEEDDEQMAARDNLSGQFDPVPHEVYHYSDPSNRASIRQQGLLTRDAQGQSLAERDGAAAGVYAFEERDQADMLEGDTWAVQTTGLPFERDPQNPTSAFYSPEPVPPGQVALVSPHPDWDEENEAWRD
jgi:hypothetical protein